MLVYYNIMFVLIVMFEPFDFEYLDFNFYWLYG